MPAGDRCHAIRRHDGGRRHGHGRPGQRCDGAPGGPCPNRTPGPCRHRRSRRAAPSPFRPRPTRRTATEGQQDAARLVCHPRPHPTAHPAGRRGGLSGGAALLTAHETARHHHPEAAARRHLLSGLPRRAPSSTTAATVTEAFTGLDRVAARPATGRGRNWRRRSLCYARSWRRSPPRLRDRAAAGRLRRRVPPQPLAPSPSSTWRTASTACASRCPSPGAIGRARACGRHPLASVICGARTRPLAFVAAGITAARRFRRIWTTPRPGNPPTG